MSLDNRSNDGIRDTGLISRNERVKVFCRVRPLLQREREGWNYEEFTQQFGEGGDTSSNLPTDNKDISTLSTFLTDRAKIESSFNSSIISIHPGNNTLSYCQHDRKEFKFDACMAEETLQTDVYEQVAQHIVRDVMNGYNGTILAYGQTSTGKTHTMLGQNDRTVGDERGIIPRAFEDIFQQADISRSTVKTSVALSYVQIYCERVFDLLRPETPPSSILIREDTERGIYLDGASMVGVSNVDDCLRLMAHGNANRAVASTGMNAHSSRSHAILIAHIERKEFASVSSSNQPPQQHIKMSQLYLVDLAGSERVKKTKVVGRHVNELKSINLSLSALGNCISALSLQQPQKHVPYRDSKLTRLLQSSLGGNAKTSMIITVSPSPSEASETLSTLQFGQRAMKVAVQAHQNILSVLDYKALYEDMQQRLDESQQQQQSREHELASQIQRKQQLEEQLMKVHLRMQHLEFECQAAKLAATEALNSSSLGGVDKTLPDATSRAGFDEKLEALVQQHEQDMAKIKAHCDVQVDTYKRLTEEAQQEWHELEDQLAIEKQNVLTSLQELKEFKQRFFQMEDETTDRIAELVDEDKEKTREHKEEKETLGRRIIEYENEIKDLKKKLAAAEEQNQQLQDQIEIEYVPKADIKQMEALYENAIAKLQARVGSLEQRSNSSRKVGETPNNNHESSSEDSRHRSTTGLPTTASTLPQNKAIPKIGRIFPASKANQMR